jgi:hypothetical protein
MPDGTTGRYLKAFFETGTGMADFPNPGYVILDKQERVGCIFAELARVRDHLL